MSPDESQISYKLFAKDGKSFKLTPKGEIAIRAILAPTVPDTAVLTVELASDGLRVVATFTTPESVVE